MIENGYRDVVDPALKSRARNWYALDWAVWGLGLMAGMALLVALTIPPDPDNGKVAQPI